MSDLIQVIKSKIRKDGEISFHDYMEMCLYHPEFGYYTSPGDKIGKQGDFYTSPYLGNAVGEMIARKMEELWRNMGKKPFTILEYGAGTGKLTEDILSALQVQEEMYQDLRYCIIERSPVMVGLGKARFKEKPNLQGKVEWLKEISEIKNFSGCVLSNELLDNFPVHRVVMQAGLMEVFVDQDNGFKEVLKPASPALTDYFSALGVVLPEGFQTEINLQAISWIKEVADALKEGYVMTIDYGDLSNEMYKSSRADGTLCCYKNHSVNDDYYAFIGEQDITAHVNFSALGYWGQLQGLREVFFSSQGGFLLEMGFNDWALKTYSGEKDIALAAQKIAMLRHALITDMGCKFKILIQEKGIAHPGMLLDS